MSMVINSGRFKSVGPEPLVFTGSVGKIGSPGTSLTYTNVPIGTATANRWIVVGIYTNFNAGRTLSTVTIGGVSATLMYAAPTLSASGARLEFWKANVPTGTTANVVATSSGSMYDGACGAWSSQKEPMFYTGAIDTSISSGVFSLSIDIPDGGAVIAMSDHGGGGGTILATSGVTQDFINVSGSLRIWGGSEDMLSVETGRSIGVTWNTPAPTANFYGLGAMSVSF